MTSAVTDHVYHMRRHFRAGATLPAASRRRHLENLRDGIRKYETEILASLNKDLGKHEFEGFGTEILLALDEIKYLLAHLDEWMEPQPVNVSMSAFPANAAIHAQPKGIVLIIAPWNYPFQLLIAPLAAAIAAGNVCVVKPSELSVHTSATTVKMLREVFPTDVVFCMEGDASVSTELLRHAWDHVFFTGSTRVGKIVAKACAEHLTPYTLELGGKSPAIVDETCDLKAAAKRIAWGKFTNAGQTCIAPDYVAIQDSVKDKFIAHLKKYIRDFYGEDPQTSNDYGRIINFAHYERVSALITSGTAIHGGRRDRASRYIEPTIIDGVTLGHPAMAEEIFGPVLPILTWREKGQLHTMLDANPNPLALYLFSKDRAFEREIIESIPYGGGCINHTLLHCAVTELPFGGIRQSGVGAYHGKAGFDTFTHYKSVLRAGAFDVPLKYPKFRKWKSKVLRLLAR